MNQTDIKALWTVAKIRDLHRPRWQFNYFTSNEVWLTCRGCDMGAYAEGPAVWPCRTAGIVYSAEEIKRREPKVPECPHDHTFFGDGDPVQPQAIFIRLAGSLFAARHNCAHVTPVPVMNEKELAV